MIVAIYRVAPNLNAWAPTGPPYSFAPQGDCSPFAEIDVPPGWMLVGDPEPILVRRIDANVMMNRDATESLTSALLGAEGFAIKTPPAGGMPMLWAQGGEAQAVVMGVEGLSLIPPASTSRALPGPSRNGKSTLPATTRRRGS